MPAEAIRIVEIADAHGQLVCANETYAGIPVGTLKYEFSGNRTIGVESQQNNAFVKAIWNLATGDKDRIGEFNLGVSLALMMLFGK